AGPPRNPRPPTSTLQTGSGDMSDIPIAPEDRGLASMTHLSGLAGYIIPLGGVLVPIIIWLVKSNHPVISAIARQAILLNIVAFCLIIVGVVMFFTVILIPFAILLWIALALGALVLPIVGAIKANDGVYYRY